MSLFDDDIKTAEASAHDIQAPDGLPEPRHNPDLSGHQDQEATLLSLYQAGRLPHALILTGPEGIGKATLAFRFARFLLSEGGKAAEAGDSLFGDDSPPATTMSISPDHPVFQRVASSGHSDMMTIERPFDEKRGRYKDEIPIEQVRKVTPFLRKTAGEGGWRIVIVDGADTMNRNGQNAILKILEEPPKQTLLMLVTHRLGAMLPTIRSRCHVLTMNRLSPDIIEGLIRKEAPDISQNDLDIVMRLAEGSIGRAQRLLQEDGISLYQQLDTLLANDAKINYAEIHKLADQLGRYGNETAYDNFVSLIQLKISNLVHDLAKKGQPTTALKSWVLLSDDLKHHFLKFDAANLDKRQAVLGAFDLFDKRKRA